MIRNIKPQYSITIIVVFAIFLMCVPISLNSTRQASFVTKWKDCYSKLEYTKEVINKHEQEEILKSFKRAKTTQDREDLLLILIKPYYRLDDIYFPKLYKIKFMNNTVVDKNNRYYFDDLYYSDNNTIVGLKDITDLTTNEPLFLMMFDMNGKLPPNTWGKDIFAAKIYDDKVEPLGEGLSLEALQQDCSPKGKGLYCSQYYLIGGDFAE